MNMSVAEQAKAHNGWLDSGGWLAGPITPNRARDCVDDMNRTLWQVMHSSPRTPPRTRNAHPLSTKQFTTRRRMGSCKDNVTLFVVTSSSTLHVDNERKDPFLACHERKSSAAAPFVNYCITLLGHIAILNLRLFSFKLSVSPVLRKLARLIASTRKYCERYIYTYRICITAIACLN